MPCSACCARPQAENCTLSHSDGSLQTFDACDFVPGLEVPLYIMWSLQPGEAGSTWLEVGLAGVSDGQGWVALGFPTTPGEMVGASAFILQDSQSDESGGWGLWGLCWSVGPGGQHPMRD